MPKAIAKRKQLKPGPKPVARSPDDYGVALRAIKAELKAVVDKQGAITSELTKLQTDNKKLQSDNKKILEAVNSLLQIHSNSDVEIPYVTTATSAVLEEGPATLSTHAIQLDAADNSASIMDNTLNSKRVRRPAKRLMNEEFVDGTAFDSLKRLTRQSTGPSDETLQAEKRELSSTIKIEKTVIDPLHELAPVYKKARISQQQEEQHSIQDTERMTGIFELSDDNDDNTSQESGTTLATVKKKLDLRSKKKSKSNPAEETRMDSNINTETAATENENKKESIYCCVGQCQSNESSTAASLHKFPSDDVRKSSVWFRLAKRCPLSQDVPGVSELKQLRICSKHFAKNAIKWREQRKGGGVTIALHKTAVPTLFPWNNYQDCLRVLVRPLDINALQPKVSSEKNRVLCSVVSCRNSLHETRNDCKVFELPEDRAIRASWLEIIERNSSAFHGNRPLHICMEHFETTLNFDPLTGEALELPEQIPTRFSFALNRPTISYSNEQQQSVSSSSVFGVDVIREDEESGLSVSDHRLSQSNATVTDIVRSETPPPFYGHFPEVETTTNNTNHCSSQQTREDSFSSPTILSFPSPSSADSHKKPVFKPRKSIKTEDNVVPAESRPRKFSVKLIKEKTNAHPIRTSRKVLSESETSTHHRKGKAGTDTASEGAALKLIPKDPATVRINEDDYVCFVPGCGNSAADGGDLSYHKLPDNPIMRQHWLKKMGFKGTLPPLPHVCSAHFRPEYLERRRNGGLVLKQCAVPTIFAKSRNRSNNITAARTSQSSIAKTARTVAHAPISSKSSALSRDHQHYQAPSFLHSSYDMVSDVMEVPPPFGHDDGLYGHEDVLDSGLAINIVHNTVMVGASNGGEPSLQQGVMDNSSDAIADNDDTGSTGFEVSEPLEFQESSRPSSAATGSALHSDANLSKMISAVCTGQNSSFLSDVTEPESNAVEDATTTSTTGLTINSHHRFDKLESTSSDAGIVMDNGCYQSSLLFADEDMQMSTTFTGTSDEDYNLQLESTLNNFLQP